MPALTGQVIMTITDGAGAPAVCVTWFYHPDTYALRNNPIAWTAPDGTVWAVGSGALIADNQMGREVSVRVNDEAGVMVRQVTLPMGGLAVTAAQLAAAPGRGGPYLVSQDFNGLTFDLS